MVSPRSCLGMRCASGTHGFYQFEGYSEIRRELGHPVWQAEASQTVPATLSDSIYLRIDTVH